MISKCLVLTICIVFAAIGANVQAKVLKGVTVRTWPYANKINGKYQGFAIDLMDEISKIVDFDYRMYLSPDGRYGIIKDNKINGMLGEVYNNRADFAVADLTVTDERKEFIDFTEPFMDSNLVILINTENAKNISSFQDLADQTDIEYGVIRWGMTYRLFSQSSDPVIRKMYLKMASNPENLLKNSKVGIDRVIGSRFAFIMESPTAEYLCGRYCDLTYIDDKTKYFVRHYAIAMPKDSVYTTEFSSAISQLKASGRLTQLKAKYWPNRCQTIENNLLN